MRFKVFTGPVAAKEIGQALWDAGYRGLTVGTEHVYFNMPDVEHEDVATSLLRIELRQVHGKTFGIDKVMEV